MMYVLDRSARNGVIVKPETCRVICEYLQIHVRKVPADNAGNVSTAKKGDHDGFL